MHPWLNRPVELAPLVVFRILFGAVAVYSTVRFAAYGWIHEQYVAPKLFFPYYGWEWLPRPSEKGMYVLFGLMLLGALGILLGAFYRWSAGLFFLAFTYVELLDKTNYLNHYYFVSLVALVMLFLPAHRNASVDVWRRPKTASSRAPWWTVHAPKMLLTLLYFFAGVAKLHPEWLLDAQPLRIWLPQHTDLPLIGPLLDEVWVAYAFSWGGALFDLLVGFALWSNRWRKWAYLAVLGFHSVTWALFPIGVFPLMMMVVTLVFFPPRMHRRALEVLGVYAASARTFAFREGWGRLVGGLGVVFLVVQLVYPFRYALYPGDLFWNEEGFRFSWRVMLMEKAGKAFFYVKDARYPGEKEVVLGQYLTPNQEKQMSTQPDMLLYFAHWIAAEYARQGVQDPKVRAEVWVDLNGEGSHLFLDPYYNLLEAEDGFHHQPWIIPRDSVITLDGLEALRPQLRAQHGW